MKKPISIEALRNTLRLLDLYKRQRELLDETREALQERVRTLREFVRANYTDDKEAFNAMGGEMARGKEVLSPIYSPIQTHVWEVRAREWLAEADKAAMLEQAKYPHTGEQP